MLPHVSWHSDIYELEVGATFLYFEVTPLEGGQTPPSFFGAEEPLHPLGEPSPSLEFLLLLHFGATNSLRYLKK